MPGFPWSAGRRTDAANVLPQRFDVLLGGASRALGRTDLANLVDRRHLEHAVALHPEDEGFANDALRVDVVSYIAAGAALRPVDVVEDTLLLRVEQIEIEREACMVGG